MICTGFSLEHLEFAADTSRTVTTVHPESRRRWRLRESILSRRGLPWLVLALTAVTAFGYAFGVEYYCSRYGGTDCSWGFSWLFAGAYAALAAAMTVILELAGVVLVRVSDRRHLMARFTVFRSAVALLVWAVPMYAVVLVATLYR